MGMICDACGTKFARDDGQSTLNVSPPRIDFKLIQALTEAGQSYEHREHLHLDLCLSCTAKVLSHLSLSTEICELPQLPTAPSDPASGALTEEDLRQLGLTEPGTSGV
jgi:hypothetical protein